MSPGVCISVLAVVRGSLVVNVVVVAVAVERVIIRGKRSKSSWPKVSERMDGWMDGWEGCQRLVGSAGRGGSRLCSRCSIDYTLSLTCFDIVRGRLVSGRGCARFERRQGESERASERRA